MRTGHRARRSLPVLFTCAAAILLTAALSAGTAFAWNGGILFKAGHSHSKKKAHGAVSAGYRVSRLRFIHHQETKPAPTSAPTPAPTPTLPLPRDTTPPSTAIVTAPPSTTTATTATFTFSAGEIASFECKLDSGPWGGCISPKIYSSLGVGSHQFSVRATDLSGNVDSTPATRDWSVTAPQPPDTTSPKTSITGGPESSTTATVASFSFASSESGSSFECKLDSGPWGGCTSPAGYTGLALGSHQFSVRAEDAAGNVDKTPATLTWTIEAPTPPPPADTTPPDTSITGGPESSTTATVASFSFSASESGASFECKLDGGNWSGCNSPATYTGLGVGSHQFAVRAKDTAGNIDATPASFGWTVEASATPPDTTAPETSISSGPSSITTATSASFSFASSESGSSFECKLDSGSYANCASPTSFSSLDVGAHQFSVRATDMAGNTDSTPATQAWTIEAVTPPPNECTSTVSSISAAQSAVSSATAGSMICLANGSYGKVTLSASKAAPGVTLRAQNPGGATIESASLSGSHLTLARFVIPNGVVIQPGANSMTVEHNRITGGGEGVDACPTEKTWCSEMRIIGNQLIGPFGEDAIHANRYHGLYVEGNEITHVRENGAHSDCLQTVWRGDHITFRKNYLHDNRCQGFFVKDQTLSTTGLPGGPVESIIVEDNLFLRNKEPCGAPLGPSECGQPMYFQLVGPYTGFVMKRNTIWGDGVDSIAAFREGTGSDSLIENNVIYRIWTDTNMSPATLRNNTDCMRETSAGGSWSTPTGETKACSLSFANTAADDYRISGERGVDWAPSEQHFGP